MGGKGLGRPERLMRELRLGNAVSAADSVMAPHLLMPVGSHHEREPSMRFHSFLVSLAILSASVPALAQPGREAPTLLAPAPAEENAGGDAGGRVATEALL